MFQLQFLFLNSFSLGGGFITADLAECLKIQFNEAERLKHKVLLGWQATPSDVYNLEGDEFMQTYSAKATNEIVTDRIEMICEYILRCLDNCVYDLPEFLPIYITGGGLNYTKGVKNVFNFVFLLLSVSKKIAHRAGDKVKAFIDEKTTAVAIVTANC